MLAQLNKFRNKTMETIARKYPILPSVVEIFFLDGKTFVVSVTRAVNMYWHDPLKYNHHCINRTWVSMMLETWYFPLHKQGNHVKRKSILSDPDAKERCIEWLQGQKYTRSSSAYQAVSISGRFGFGHYRRSWCRCDCHSKCATSFKWCFDYLFENWGHIIFICSYIHIY